jgi:hypothetical protein
MESLSSQKPGSFPLRENPHLNKLSAAPGFPPGQEPYPFDRQQECDKFCAEQAEQAERLTYTSQVFYLFGYSGREDFLCLTAG